MASLRTQLIWVLCGSLVATVLLGLGLSLTVNSSLRQLESRPDFGLPQPEPPAPSP